MKILSKRFKFFADTTISEVFINGMFFCYSLEDAARPYGVKIAGETCLPECTLFVSLSSSTRFQKIMPILYNQDSGYEVRAGGIYFSGIRAHGGNDHANTAGCPLLGANWDQMRKIYNCSDVNKALIKRISEAQQRSELVTWEFRNEPEK